MVSTVRSRPNHYEVLGLTPAASDAEILRAFAREMSMFRARPMAAVAQISVAYETLRNPAKRRAYDVSLGLGAEPQPAPVDAAAPSPFIGAVPRARTEGLPERRLGSFIAESLRDPVSGDEPSSEPDPQPEPEAKPGVEAHLADLLAARHARDDNSRDARPVGWKRPALAVGALVLAVGLAGALLGWRGGETPPQAEPDMAIALPEATPVRDTAAVSPPPAQVAVQPDRPAAVAEPPRTERARPPLQIAVADEPQAEVGQAVASPAEEAAAEPAAAEAATASVAAALPLPNATIARTIGRIGYACGQVVSTAPVEGEAAGVFKVTCTSGQSYRAAPVRGRYHFRRWDRP